MKKGSKLYSILHHKCPHCQEGEFFVGAHPYQLKTIGDVRTNCPVCERSYIREPGFYYGAMYVSYGLAVATFAMIYVAMLVLFPDATPWTYMSVVITGLLVSTPYLFALSKILWANMFFTYKGPRSSEATPPDQGTISSGR